MREGVSRNAGTWRDRFEEEWFGGWTWRSLPGRRMKVAHASVIAAIVVMAGLAAVAFLPGAAERLPSAVMWGWIGLFFALFAAGVLLQLYGYWVSWRPSRAKRIVDRLTLQPEDLPPGWVALGRKRLSNVGEWEEEFQEHLERTVLLNVTLNLLLSLFTDADVFVPVAGDAEFARRVQEAAAAGRITGTRTLFARHPLPATDDSGIREIVSEVTVYRTGAQAHRAFAAIAGEQFRAGVGILGDESFAAPIEDGSAMTLIWRTENVIATLTTGGTPETRLADLLPLARTQSDRIFSTLTQR